MITSQFQYAEKGAAFTAAGTRVTGAATVEDVLERAGLNFDLATHPVYTHDGKRIAGKVAIHRTDTGDVLGIAGEGYRPIPPARILGVLQDVVQDAGLSFHSAGAFDNGARVWLQALFPDGFRIAGDEYRQFLTGQSGNDGGLSLKIGGTSIRIVCLNTFMAARRDLGVTVRHTGDTEVKLASVKDVLGVVSDARERFKAWAETLAVTPVTRTEYDGFERALFGIELGTPADKLPRGVEKFRAILGEEKRAAGGRATWYTVLNGVTGYADHALNTRGGDVGRWDSVLNGTAARIKDRGVALIEEIVKA